MLGKEIFTLGEGISATFVYDGDGNRVKGTVGGVTTAYVGAHIVGNHFEWTGSTSTMKKYYYAGGQRVAVRTGSSTLNFLLGDHLGSTSVTTDSNGNRTAELRYKPWGENRYTYGSTPTTYRYTGQRLESQLGGTDGLYYYGARWYDPSLGRFAQPDTIIPEQQQGVQAWDRYAFVNNNPLRYTDPTGNMMDDMGGGVLRKMQTNTLKPMPNSSPPNTETAKTITPTPQPQGDKTSQTTPYPSKDNPKVCSTPVLGEPCTYYPASKLPDIGWDPSRVDWVDVGVDAFGIIGDLSLFFP